MQDENIREEQGAVATLPRPEAHPQKVIVHSGLQFEVIQKLILDFQSSLDQEHDIGLMLTQFGDSVTMEVMEIGYDGASLIIFRGMVNGQESTLIQHISQLNFLLTSITKAPEIPKRRIGFTATPAAE